MEKSETIIKKYLKKEVPEIKAGMKVRVYERVKEGKKEKLSPFEGIVIRVKGKKDANTTFTLRNVLDGIGVEKTFFLYSPQIAKIEILEKFKVRRAKLYFIRELSPKKIKKKLKKIQ